MPWKITESSALEGREQLRYSAVIFDLFGTLVDNLSLKEHKTVLERMATEVSAPPKEFIRLCRAETRSEFVDKSKQKRGFKRLFKKMISNQ